MKIAIAAAAFLLAGSTLAATSAPLAPSAVQGSLAIAGAAEKDTLVTEVRHRRGHWGNRGRHLGWFKSNRGRHMGRRDRNWR
jgi:hypothetical protein